MIRNIFALLLIFGIGIAIGRYAAPTKVVTQEKIVYQDKIVEKKVYISDHKKQTNKVYIRLVTVKPDGTKTVETKIFDKSNIEIIQNASAGISESKSGETDKSKTEEHGRDNYILSAGARMKVDSLLPVYGGSFQRRILGPFWLGVDGYQDKTFGTTIGISF